MGMPDNPLGAIWPAIYVQQPAGPGIHFPAGPRDVPHILGDYALLQTIHDHVLPNCQRIDASGVLCGPSDEIWQNVVTFAEGESGSKGYVNTGLIDRAMENVTADLETWRTGNEEDAAKGSGQQLDIQALIERLRLLQSALEDASGDADRIRGDLKVFVGSADRLYDALQEPLRGSTPDALERLAWVGAARRSRVNMGLYPALLDALAVPEFIAELESSSRRLNRAAGSTTSGAPATDEGGGRQRDLDAFVSSAGAVTRSKSFMEWTGDERVTLAIVFTDVVASTALGDQIKDEAMNEVRRAHFAQSRTLIDQFRGREIKTIGDSFMAAFRSVEYALDYALAFRGNTGHPQVRIRAGIHIGPMQLEEGDVFGGTVNFAARVVGAIKDDEIWVSARAKEDIDQLGASRHKQLKWERHDQVQMKGFSGTFTLWSLRR
jgi:class 3 adenylate cyclase